MRRALAALLLIAVIGTPLLAAGETVPDAGTSMRPMWCKPGYICLRREEVAADTLYHYELQTKASRAKRFGLTAGVGLGVGGVVDDDFDVRWVPTGGLFVVWGYRF